MNKQKYIFKVNISTKILEKHLVVQYHILL